MYLKFAEGKISEIEAKVKQVEALLKDLTPSSIPLHAGCHHSLLQGPHAAEGRQAALTRFEDLEMEKNEWQWFDFTATPRTPNAFFRDYRFDLIAVRTEAPK